MVAPARHTGDFGELEPGEVVEIHPLAAGGDGRARAGLRAAGLQPRLEPRPVAGAGIADHVHLHVVPRWSGDTNFMPVLADVKVLPEHLIETRSSSPRPGRPQELASPVRETLVETRTKPPFTEVLGRMYRCSIVRSSTRHVRRAWGGGFAVLASAFAFALLIAPAARATPLPPSLSPLPGSSFQGADGNQDDALPAIDWQALQAAERVHHSPDPNGQDSAFTGGTEEDKPGLWDLTTEAGGVNPAKSNIFDAWSAFDPQGGNAFLYLGFSREAASLLRIRPRAATTFITFELNHDPRLWDNGRATIPCRSTGDVLVSYEAQGNDVSVEIQRWVTTQTDPASGCATTGHLENSTGFAPNVDAQGAVNETEIRTYLPGKYVGTIPTSASARRR